LGGRPLASAGFAVPRRLATEDVRLEPLGPQHNDVDHVVWTTGIARIRATPGFAGREWLRDCWPWHAPHYARR
jgi:hypothetical protein